MNGSSIAWGLGLAALGALFVFRTKQGTKVAAWTGFLVAGSMALGFGVSSIAPLSLFVLGSGFLTRLGRDRKERLRAAEPERGRRGAAHVVAKLGVPALLGWIAFLRPDLGLVLALALSASLAAAFADTSATEAGPLGRGYAVRWRGYRWTRVPHGEPGGVSLAGLAAALAAAALVAVVSWIVGLLDGIGAAALVTGIGFLSTAVESVISGLPIGARLGHFGRNAFLSAFAAIAGWLAAHAIGWSNGS